MTWLPARRLRVLPIIRFCVIEMEPTELIKPGWSDAPTEAPTRCRS
jgi:hypothetical protein